MEAQADGDLRRVPAGDTAADDDGAAREHTGDTAGQHTATAVGGHQVVGADLGARRPATSDIGASSGSARLGSSTVS